MQVFLQRAIIKPTLALHRGIQDMSAGREDIKVAVESDDELGMLAESFNAMVAERKQAHLALQVQASRQRITLDSLLDAVITVDHKLMIQSLNKSAVELLELQPEQVIGKRIDTVVRLMNEDGVSTWQKDGLDKLARSDHSQLLLMVIMTVDPKFVSTTWALLRK